MGLPGRTAEKRPGVVVPEGSFWGGSPSWQSQTGRVWVLFLVLVSQKQMIGVWVCLGGVADLCHFCSMALLPRSHCTGENEQRSNISLVLGKPFFFAG